MHTSKRVVQIRENKVVCKRIVYLLFISVLKNLEEKNPLIEIPILPLKTEIMNVSQSNWFTILRLSENAQVTPFCFFKQCIPQRGGCKLEKIKLDVKE
jgi:hypothetical protein